MFIWNLPAEVRARDFVRGYKDEFPNSLYHATKSAQMTLAADTSMKKINIWILELQHYAMTWPWANWRWRKAVELVVKHTATNLTYFFGNDPRMETIFSDGCAVREVLIKLKKLYFLKNMTDVWIWHWLFVAATYAHMWHQDYIHSSVRSTGGQFLRNVYYITNSL